MSLRKWLDERWVRLDKKGSNGEWLPCGRSNATKGGYPLCRPISVARRLSQKEIDQIVRKKRKNPSKNIKHPITSSGRRRKKTK